MIKLKLLFNIISFFRGSPFRHCGGQRCSLLQCGSFTSQSLCVTQQLWRRRKINEQLRMQCNKTQWNYWTKTDCSLQRGRTQTWGGKPELVNVLSARATCRTHKHPVFLGSGSRENCKTLTACWWRADCWASKTSACLGSGGKLLCAPPPAGLRKLLFAFPSN